MSHKIKTLCLWVILIPFMGGCASIAKGVTSAFIEKSEVEKDTRSCDIKGYAFNGLETYLRRQEAFSAENGNPENRPTLKVLMIHGIGEHPPGYSIRFSTNLTRELKLNATEERTKRVDLKNPNVSNEQIGHLDVNRYFNKARSREMIFYELSWSDIIADEKKKIEYDNLATSKRAGVNSVMKKFINSHIPDPMIYLGDSQKKIIASVGQALCWMFSGDWEDLNYHQSSYCNARIQSLAEELEEDDYAFVTHSLGSRIVIDALQAIAEAFSGEGGEETEDLLAYPKIRELHEALQNKRIPIFMLANQLPLLQLGREEPTVTGQLDQYCREGGQKHKQRLFKELPILAFSDPNDLLSYEIPPKYAMDNMDSRICPKMTNISINIAKVISIFGLGEVANPAEAHGGYDNDERVIKLIVHGIGHDNVSSLVKNRCILLEVVGD